MSKKIDKVIVCADDAKVMDLMKKYNQEVYMTSKNIRNGTDRISIFLKKNIKKFKNLQLVVDIQCDEVFLNPNYLDRVIDFHLKKLDKYDVIVPHTLTEESNNKNYVKIVSNKYNKIMYMTRADAPFSFRSKLKPFKRHQDFITFKPDFIIKFNDLKNKMLEKYEGIELLRVLENEYSMGTIRFKDDSFSINTKKDLLKSILLIRKDKHRKLY